jgi:hypothetical protein
VVTSDFCFPARSGVQMAVWPAKGMGISFGGVFDSYDTEDDDLTSVFYNELYGYQIANGPNGKWISLNLKRPKQKKKGPNKAKLRKLQQKEREEEERQRREEEDDEEHQAGEDDKASLHSGTGDEEAGESVHSNRKFANGQASAPANGSVVATTKQSTAPASDEEDEDEDEDDPDDPQKTVPMARYNAMMAIQRNTLYIYGGIVESQEREFTLDDFYTLQLDKLDRYTCLKECNIAELEWKESDDDDSDDDSSESGGSSDDDDEEGDHGDEGEENTLAVPEEVKPDEIELTEEEIVAQIVAQTERDAAALRAQATAFMGVAKNTDRSAEDTMSTPLPGETLKTFYDRTSAWCLLNLSFDLLADRDCRQESIGHKKHINTRRKIEGRTFDETAFN